jgi:NAD(P)-dependent dehydrogenase (short-subunit alcohol dehydrogenase family)
MSKSFGAESTTDEVLEGVSLSGRRVLVTGVSAGLGVETARALAAHGAEVVGAARDLTKAKTATASVRADAANGGSLELIELDLASLASVRACAAALVANGKPFDLVICNAGVMATPFGKTADGFETQFGTNHLGHFVLVNRIASLMKPGGRLVNLSSAGHQLSDVDLDDPNFERAPYSAWASYGRSKTANILFAVEFDRRHKDRGIRAAALHPGAIQTELSRYLDEEAWRELKSWRRSGACRAGNRSATNRSRKAPRRPSGRRRSRRPTRSAGATARIVTSPRSSTRPVSPSPACAPMRLTLRQPRRCGRRARSWSASASPKPG